MLCASGCTKSLTNSNTSACLIPFDYGDDGVNERNARGLLMHYCLCHDNGACK